MLAKDHEQKISPHLTIRNRRVQRCLSFALVFICIAIILTTIHHSSLPKPTELHLDTITGLHKYTSSPEAGMPPLPFVNNAIRKATVEPFFDVEYEDEDDEDDVADEEEKAKGEVITQLIQQKLVTREQVERIGPEGLLVGAH